MVIAWSIADCDRSKSTEAGSPSKVFYLHRTMSRLAQVRVVCSMTGVACLAETKGLDEQPTSGWFRSDTWRRAKSGPHTKLGLHSMGTSMQRRAKSEHQAKIGLRSTRGESGNTGKC